MLAYLLAGGFAFFATCGIVALAVRIVRDCETARRKAELRRARLERDWQEGRFDA